MLPNALDNSRSLDTNLAEFSQRGMFGLLETAIRSVNEASAPDVKRLLHLVPQKLLRSSGEVTDTKRTPGTRQMGLFKHIHFPPVHYVQPIAQDCHAFRIANLGLFELIRVHDAIGRPRPQ